MVATKMYLGVDPGGRYRVVAESLIVRSLMRGFWLDELLAGAEDWVRQQAQQTLERWVKAGLPYQFEGGQRVFDPTEVGNFGLWADIQGIDNLFRTQAMVKFRRMVDRSVRPAFWTEEPSAQDTVRFEVCIKREFDLADRPGAARLRLPCPYADETQGDISVEVLEPDPARVRLVQEPGRLEVHSLPGPERIQAVEVRIGFTSRCRRVKVDPAGLEPWDRTSAEYQLYTRPSDGWFRATEPVCRLARSLAAGARNAWEVIRAFWGHFFDKMMLLMVHHDELDHADILGSLIRRGWADCYLASALLVAMCRAEGIPARLIGGYFLYDTLVDEHYWVEVLLPPFGWLPLDLTSWLLTRGEREPVLWSERYLGQIDHRMKVQCFPRTVIGPLGGRSSTAWVRTAVLDGTWTELVYTDLSGRLLYRDRLLVRRTSA